MMECRKFLSDPDHFCYKCAEFTPDRDGAKLGGDFSTASGRKRSFERPANCPRPCLCARNSAQTEGHAIGCCVSDSDLYYV